MTRENTTERLTDADTRAIKRAAKSIHDHFSWIRTSSGGDYWNEVYDKLMELAGEE